jgi:hypothetical protein
VRASAGCRGADFLKRTYARTSEDKAVRSSLPLRLFVEPAKERVARRVCEATLLRATDHQTDHLSETERDGSRLSGTLTFRIHSTHRRRKVAGTHS